MVSDSDEELPSLATLVARIGERPTPTLVRKQHSPIQDPAEEAIVSKAKDRSRASRLQTISRPNSSSSVDHDTPSRPKGKSGRAAATSSKQMSRSTSRQTLEVSSKASRTPTATSSSHVEGITNQEDAHRDETCCTSRGPQHRLAIPPITTSKHQSSASSSAQAAATPVIPDIASPGPTVVMTYSVFGSPLGPVSLLPEPITARISASNSKPYSSSSSAIEARKKRRITIITISDSEDDEDVPPLPARSREPSRTPSLITEDKSEEQDDLAEEVSFADYSDDDGIEPDGTAKKPAPSRRVIEIDSSDSEYDTAAGVISWNPMPNKLKHIVKPSTVSSTIPPLSDTGGPHTDALSKRTLAPITPAKGKSNKSSSSKILTASDTTPSLKVNPVPTTASKGRTSRKNSAFAKERDELAMQLIEELNATVFQGRLPEDLTVVWNGRLNTTAGRANWKKITKKSTEATVYKAEIELSVKVIDSEEKLKCTLAHELCHIAAWAIDKEMKPAHGPAFKAWGKRIMRCRQDITVSTKHTYEIDYKYQWQCKNTDCMKIYGRHSKSIDTTRQACGACSGRLVRLDKDGRPVVEGDDAAATAKKESEWAIFSKGAFKRIKQEQPTLTMTQINKIVVAEWADIKAKKALQASSIRLLAQEIETLSM